MPAILALTGIISYLAINLLCVDILLKNVRKVRGDEFRVLMAWVFMFFGMGLFFTREAVVTGIGGIDASAKFQLASVFIAIFILLTVSKSNSIKFITLKPVVYLFGYAVVSAATVIVSPAPLITLYKAALLFVDIYLICATINVFKGRQSYFPIEICYFIAALFAAGSLLGVVINPEAALLPSKGAVGVMLKGLYPTMNSNELGFLGALAMILGIRRYFSVGGFRYKLYWIGMAYMGFVVMFLAQARTSLVTALLALIFLSFVIKKMRWIFFVSIIFLAVSIIYTTVSGNVAQWQESAIDSTIEYAQRGQKDDGLQTLKGRADAWQSTGLKMFIDSPLIGHGYDAGVRYDYKYGMAGSHMHNSHIQIIANTGLLGYITWIGFILSVVFLITKLFFKNHYPPKDEQSLYFVEMCAVLILILLRTMTGQVMVTHQWSLLIFMGIFIHAYNCKINANSNITITRDDSDKPSRTEKRILWLKKPKV